MSAMNGRGPETRARAQGDGCACANGPSSVWVEALIAEIFSGEQSLAELVAEREELGGLDGVSMVLNDPAVRERLAAIRRAFDGHTQLTVARNRADAALALGKLARDASSGETARKACVDLLRLPASSTASERETPTPEDRAPDATLDEQTVLRVLAAFGERSSPVDEPASGSSTNGPVVRGPVRVDGCTGGPL